MSNPKPPIEVENILENLVMQGLIKELDISDFDLVRQLVLSFTKPALAALNRAYGEQMLGLVGEDELIPPHKNYIVRGYESTVRNKLRRELRAAINKQYLGDEDGR